MLLRTKNFPEREIFKGARRRNTKRRIEKEEGEEKEAEEGDDKRGQGD